ncbi:hypothetical protein D9619_005729 [Psilocybe cf. subviscida]|uniref:Aminoglycoside phosphotransferase domain-containing protein n=1 Tax=Psilocybe cf. subviscida TaxID=2480587 RepID=A0A8H5BXW4_9AGAR|nr:hypothetical protein D9619_005729 [Psilocybe cf. subviscida]
MFIPETWLCAIETLAFFALRPLLLCNFGRKANMLSTHTMTDDEILELMKISSGFIDANQFVTDEGTWNPGRVSQIGIDAVAKRAFRPYSEHRNQLVATNLVHSTTSIPVPLCDRVINRGSSGTVMIQQYIPGVTVHKLWPVLSWWTRLRIVLTLRFYILELRSIASRFGDPVFPGPVSDDNQPQFCTGRLFAKDDRSGPFKSYREMARWYQNRLLLMQKFRDASPDIAPFDSSAPLAFTHMDIHPLNLIMGNDGQLWMVDWQDAGWYPQWFEGASMHLFGIGRKNVDPSWLKMRPFITGPCQKPGQIPFMIAIGYTLIVLQSNIIDLIGASENGE